MSFFYCSIKPRLVVESCPPLYEEKKNLLSVRTDITAPAITAPAHSPSAHPQYLSDFFNYPSLPSIWWTPPFIQLFSLSSFSAYVRSILLYWKNTRLNWSWTLLPRIWNSKTFCCCNPSLWHLNPRTMMLWKFCRAKRIRDGCLIRMNSCSRFANGSERMVTEVICWMTCEPHAFHFSHS